MEEKRDQRDQGIRNDSTAPGEQEGGVAAPFLGRTHIYDMKKRKLLPKQSSSSPVIIRSLKFVGSSMCTIISYQIVLSLINVTKSPSALLITKLGCSAQY